MNRFKVIWEVDDGYVGGARPQTLYIYADEVLDLPVEELRFLFWDRIQSDFDQKARPVCSMEDAFVNWASQQTLEDDAE